MNCLRRDGRGRISNLVATHGQIAMRDYRLPFQWALQVHLIDGPRLVSGRYFHHPNWLGLQLIPSWRPSNDNGVGRVVEWTPT